MFPQLDRYQKEAYWALMKIARQHGGAFLCDGVGLGKTFVGLMLIERLVLHEGKRVVLFAPKAAKEAVWEPHLREWLPHIGGVGGSADFSNLAVFSHTDLGRKGDFPERFRRIAELADAVIIDEAHHFRNPGRRGDAEDGDRAVALLPALRPARRRDAAEDGLHADRDADQQPAQRLPAHGRALHPAGRGVLRPDAGRQQPAARTSTTWRRLCRRSVGTDAADAVRAA